MNHDFPLDNAILDLLPDGVVAVDRELTVIRLNRAACRLLDLRDEAELLGSPVSRVMEDELFIRLLRGESTHLSDSVSIMDGAIWLERSFYANAERTLFLCLLHDGTQERREREAALQVTELAEAISRQQLSVVHDIASLLGETALETQSKVYEIKQALRQSGEGRHG